MPSIVESNITLDFPTASWFRFEKTDPYQPLSGLWFKEMDACWLDAANNIFYAIELKDYTESKNPDEHTIDHRRYDLLKKVVDTIQMVMSAKYQTEFGKELETIKGIDLHTSDLIYHYLIIVKEKEENMPMFQALKDNCRDMVKPYLTVWGHSRFSMMTYDNAKTKFPNFVK